MSVDYKDYYSVLGVPKTASQDEIAKAYKKLARTYHPDLNQEPGAEDRFKEVGEAYEVLKDPETRKRYDTLGANWKAGQGFNPPPGWENFAGGGGFGGGGGPSNANFSDFFNMFFNGGGGPQGFGGGFGGGGFGGGFGGQARRPRRGQDHEVDVEVTLHEVAHGTRKEIPLRIQEQRPDGSWDARTHTYTVTIPAGTTDGKVLRLSGQGGPGAFGGAAGDLLLRVQLAPHPDFTVEDHDLTTRLTLAPWEAALGARVEVPTLDEPVSLKIPAGVRSGLKLRLRGKGLPRKKGNHGDLFVELHIAAPKALSDRERALFEELAAVSTFNPREG